MTRTELESSEELLSQDDVDDVSNKAGDRRIAEAFKETVMMFCSDSLEGTAMMFPCCTCPFLDVPLFPYSYVSLALSFCGKER